MKSIRFLESTDHQREELMGLILARYAEGESIRVMASEYGVSHMTLYRWMRRHGYTRRHKRSGIAAVTPEKIERNAAIVAEYLDGKGRIVAEEIADRYGISRNRVYLIINRHYVRHPEDQARNPNRPRDPVAEDRDALP